MLQTVELYIKSLVIPQYYLGIKTIKYLHQLQNLKSYFNKQTLIVVTHRMSLLQLVDRVIAVDDGKVTVDGTRDSILSKLKERQA